MKPGAALFHADGALGGLSHPMEHRGRLAEGIDQILKSLQLEHAKMVFYRVSQKGPIAS